MDLRTRLQAELAVRRTIVARAYDRLKHEEREANREKRSVPAELRSKLNDAIREAKGNVGACIASLEACCKYPPLRIGA